MFTTLLSDRKHIENKYHIASEPFDPFRRMAYHGMGYDEETGLDDEGIIKGLEAMEKDLSSLPHPVAKAKAVEYVLENNRLYINEHDYFIGMYSLNRLADRVTFSKWEKEALKMRKPELLELYNDFNASGAVSIWPDYDHVVPDWDSLMTLGFPGILERAREYRLKKGALTEEQKAFFDGIEIEYSAIIEFLRRAYRHALTKKHKKAEEVAAALLSLSNGAPKNIYEAMMLIHIYFLVSESIDHFQVRSLGNGLDYTLYPFYSRDLEAGTFTHGEIRELLGYFLLQWSAIGNYWGQPFYLGGTNRDGSTKYNELSADILDVYDALGLYNPKIQIKVNKNTPKEILSKVLEMVRHGVSSFVFCCEPGMIKAVMSYGASYEEALTYDIRGCYETGVRANEVCSASGYINAAKAVEYALSDGYDVLCGKQIGLRTGNIENFVTFEDFYRAVILQWEYLIEKSIEITNDFERFFGFVNPSSMYSATVITSLENSRDGYQGGVKFNNSAMLNCGFASLVASVMAVREFVYGKKELTLPQLKAVLDNNWEGHELLRLRIKKSSHKYGNGNEMTDLYTEMLGRYFANKVNNRPNARGGVFKAIIHSARQYVVQGNNTPATPDGRKSGEELSKNASPSAGMDKNGVTALLSSVTKINPTLYPESFCLDVFLHPSAVQGEDGIAAMRGIIYTYMQKDGMSLQFNVFSSETLRDAQKNPEKYKNLQVRVCGWNVLWNNLSREEQEMYIRRAENAT